MEKISTSLILSVILLVLGFGISCVAKNTSFGCVATERKTLLKFKASLVDPSNRLSSWKDMDCCTWEGVTCDLITGHAIKLDLGNSYPWDYRLHSESLNPSLLELKYLTYLDLSGNNFEYSTIPEFLGSMKQLQSLYLNSNNFSGHLPEELGELKKLISLGFSNSRISGPIPASIGNLSSLEWLDASGNMLSGPIPSSLGNLRALRYLSLTGNQLSGEIPVSLGQLSHLEVILLSVNSFNATLYEAHFTKLSKLEHFEASSNSLFKFRVGYDWVPPFQLRYLDMRSSNFGGQFPQWIRTQKALTYLNLQNCSISGTLPKWLYDLNLEALYLSENRIYGAIPELCPSMSSLDLSDNMLNGLPSNNGEMAPPLTYLRLARNVINGSQLHSLCNMKTLNALDLSSNSLSGNLPDCWSNFPDLEILRLSSNELSGIIPQSIGGAYSLKWLQLNNNSLTGQLPSTLKNCEHLQVLDVGENNLSGNIPEWMGEYMSSMQALILGSNEFHGVLPRALCQASQLQILDLANNRLTGKIPNCFGNFSGMILSRDRNRDLNFMYAGGLREGLRQMSKGKEMEYFQILPYLVNLDLSSNNLVGEIPLELTHLSNLHGLNLSHNHLAGIIPGTIGDMKSLESLDLSNNNLSGRIPDSMLELSFLSYLNLSNNNLSGKIPIGRQLQTLDNPSMYDGNPQLCGAPLLKRCPGDEAPKTLNNSENHSAANEDSIDKICFYAFVIGGFAMGFWGFIGFLVFKKSWRHAYFGIIEAKASQMLGR